MMSAGIARWLKVPALMTIMLGCSQPEREGPNPNVPAGSILLKGAGSTLVAVLFKQWFNAYQTQYPNIAIKYDVVGSGEGIRRFIGKNVKEEEDVVDFGASDAALNDDQIPQVSRGAVLLPVTASSIVLAYNLPDVAGDLKLSRRAYAGIFLGEIKRWDDRLIAESNPGKKLPKLEIYLAVRLDGSGTTFAFTKHLDAISQKWHERHGAQTLVGWPENAMRAPGNEGVAGIISRSIGSIGYVAYAYAREAGLSTALLENKEGRFVKSTDQSCVAALGSQNMPKNLRFYVPDPSGPDSYPIVTYSWALLYSKYKDSGKTEAIRDLFRWCLLNGQKYASGAGYVELPPNVTTQALSALNTISNN